MARSLASLLAGVLLWCAALSAVAEGVEAAVDRAKLKAMVKKESFLQRSAQIPPSLVHDPQLPHALSVPYYGPKVPNPMTYTPTVMPKVPIYQPFDSAGGAPSIPTSEPPPPPSPAQLAQACPAIPIPDKMVLRAPDGCVQQNRHNLWTNEISAPIVKWQENCFAMPNPEADITFTSSVNAQRLATTRTKPTATTQEIEITDCNFQAQYVMHEVLYQKTGPALTACGTPPCGDMIYVRWYLVEVSTQKVVAMTTHVPLFTQTIKLTDATGLVDLATLTKNGDWSPLDKCPADGAKNWQLAFPLASSPDVQGAPAGSLLMPNKRWVIAAFATHMALRDDSRRGDGLVTIMNCPRPLLDPSADIQPMDTWLGNAIQSQFIDAPTVTPPPTQQAIDFVHSCYPRGVANRIVVQAPTGCDDRNRHAQWQNTTGEAITSWKENCFTYNSPDLDFTDVVNGKRLTTTWTQKTAYSNKVDITDCNLNVLYTMHEEVYKKAGSSLIACRRYGSCDGEIYLRYHITSRNNKVVAVTSYLPLFVSEFKLIDPNTAITLATIKKNGDWSPLDRCPKYQKQWIVTFLSSATSGNGNSVGLGTQDKRWVIAAFVTQMALRDDSRKPDGMVKFSTCETDTWASTGILFGIIAVVLATFVVMFVRMKWRESLIKSCLGIEHFLLPRVMAKPIKHSI